VRPADVATASVRCNKEQPRRWRGRTRRAVLFRYVVKSPFAVKVSSYYVNVVSGPWFDRKEDRALLGHGPSRQYHLVKADDTLNIGSPTSIEVEHEEPNRG
jgi:hypothetical protein